MCVCVFFFFYYAYVFLYLFCRPVVPDMLLKKVQLFYTFTQKKATSYNNIVLNIIPTLYEGYIVSVLRMVIENRPVDPGSIQGSHRAISFIRIKHRTRENDFFVKLGFNNHIVGLVHKNHFINEI